MATVFAKSRQGLDSSDQRLASDLFLLSRFISELYGNGDGFLQALAAGVLFDASRFQELPASEPQRTESMIMECEELFHAISKALSGSLRSQLMVIRGECVQLMVQLTEIQPMHRSFSYVENPAAERWRPRLQGFGFDCLSILLELAPTSFLFLAHDPLHTAIKLLSTRGKPKDVDQMKTFAELYEKLYRFLVLMLDDKLLSDLFSPGHLRDLTDSTVSDISQLSNINLQYQATICSTVLLQAHGNRLKSDTKNELFTALVLAVQKKMQTGRERGLSPFETQLCLRIFGALTAFILSSSVHIGVLNICNAVFEDGLCFGDLDINICCRQGKQVLSTILRPRCPREVFENVTRIDDAATGLVILPVMEEVSFASEKTIFNQVKDLLVVEAAQASVESERKNPDAEVELENPLEQLPVEKTNILMESAVSPEVESLLESVAAGKIEDVVCGQNIVDVVPALDSSATGDHVPERLGESARAEIVEDMDVELGVAEEVKELVALFSAAMSDDEDGGEL